MYHGGTCLYYLNLNQINRAGIRAQPGTVLKNTHTGETIYTHPTGESIIREKLKNLEEYINLDEDEVDPLIKMAVMHYQFESIHPFYDGNGSPSFSIT